MYSYSTVQYESAVHKCIEMCRLNKISSWQIFLDVIIVKYYAYYYAYHYEKFILGPAVYWRWTIWSSFTQKYVCSAFLYTTAWQFTSRGLPSRPCWISTLPSGISDSLTLKSSPSSAVPFSSSYWSVGSSWRTPSSKLSSIFATLSVNIQVTLFALISVIADLESAIYSLGFQLKLYKLISYLIQTTLL